MSKSQFKVKGQSVTEVTATKQRADKACCHHTRCLSLCKFDKLITICLFTLNRGSLVCKIRLRVLCMLQYIILCSGLDIIWKCIFREERWLSVKVSASQPRGCGFEPVIGLRPWFLKLHQHWLVPGSSLNSDLHKLWEIVSQSSYK